MTENDADTQKVLKLLQTNGVNFTNLGGLSRGIKFEDWEVGKRIFNHYNDYAAPSITFINGNQQMNAVTIQQEVITCQKTYQDS